MSADGWLWAQELTNKPALLPADYLNSPDLRPVGNPSYFRSVTVRKLAEHEGRERHRLFHKWFGKERITIYPEVWEVIATNAEGKSLSLNVFKKANDASAWGIACLPDCGRMRPFIMLKKTAKGRGSP